MQFIKEIGFCATCKRFSWCSDDTCPPCNKRLFSATYTDTPVGGPAASHVSFKVPTPSDLRQVTKIYKAAIFAHDRDWLQVTIRNILPTLAMCHRYLPVEPTYTNNELSRLCCIRREGDTRVFKCSKHCQPLLYSILSDKPKQTVNSYLDKLPTDLMELTMKYMCEANSLPFDAPTAGGSACALCIARIQEVLHNGKRKRTCLTELLD